MRASATRGGRRPSRAGARAINDADRRLLGYLPATIVGDLARDAYESRPPVLHTLRTVALFGDVSGFTALSERLAQEEASPGTGAEKLAFYLNSYFTQVVKLIAKSGGDIFKFAGDALLVLWPEVPGQDLATRVQLAAQCAQQIQRHMHDAGLGPPGKEVRLSVHC